MIYVVNSIFNNGSKKREGITKNKDEANSIKVISENKYLKIEDKREVLTEFLSLQENSNRNTFKQRIIELSKLKALHPFVFKEIVIETCDNFTIKKRKIQRLRDGSIFIPLDYEKSNVNLTYDEIQLKNKYGGFHPTQEELDSPFNLIDENIDMNNIISF